MSKFWLTIVCESCGKSYTERQEGDLDLAGALGRYDYYAFPDENGDCTLYCSACTDDIFKGDEYDDEY